MIAAASLAAPLLIVSAGPATGAPRFTGETLAVDSRVVSDKAPTSRVAKPDPALLARTDAAPVSMLVKLDYDSTATYAGGVGTLAATSPSVTGKPLTGSQAEQSYDSYQAGKEADFAKRLQAVAPGASIDRRLRVVYGGVAVTVPADKAKAVQAIPGVVAVQQNQMRQMLADTDSGADFIGAPTIYNQLKTTPNAGQGLILANLDSGVWPEHPSLADQGNLPAPPGPARTCVFGDNPLTPANDPFVCNHKLIGGAAFTKTYDAQVGDDPYAGTARDSEGHGTHTATTSAGNIVKDVSILGSKLPAIHGIAPGAYVMEYKVCGPQGCFSADSAAAVGQAILDHVDAINFSISGGTDPFTDPVELSFLDAYAANVFVSASAGNSGPTAGTANHLAPWTVSVAASTQTREFANTLTLTAGGATFTAEGASITKGAGPAPVVLGSAAPYGHVLCDAPAAAGTLTGKIVACQRGGNARIDKGYNVKQGGAAGMILYNPTLADVETDNHWLPATHLADGTAFLAFMNTHTDVTGSFTAGAVKQGKGDVMAAFSSRGPGGTTIKPDLTAPGVEVLAGMTPTPLTTTDGPPGQYFQAIAGTSMSSPHVAGSALLLRALHPTWTPGQIRSALMTTALTSVVKEDLKTPADPFDFGAGRIDLNNAGAAALTFDENADDMALEGNNPLTAVNLNIPSVDAPVMPGRVVTTRRAVNVTNHQVQFLTSATAPAGSTINVEPAGFVLAPGRAIDLKITIKSTKPTGTQQFGQIQLTPRRGDGPALHMPVAFVPQQGSVTLASGCSPGHVPVGQTTTCTVTAQNTSFTDTTANLRTRVDNNLKVVSATGATVLQNGTVDKQNVQLKGNQPGVPAVAPGPTPAGYLPLDQYGITPTPIGDEEFLNLTVPPFVYAGVTYTSLAISSNGFIKAGTADATDQNCCNLPTGPDPAPPNTMVAPFWTDLDGTGAPGVLAGTLTDGVNSWIVIEHRVNVFGTTSQRVFETWIGTNGPEDITMVYDPANLPAAPGAQPFLVGAENLAGQGQISPTLPTQDLRVTSTAPTPGDTVSYTVKVQGKAVGKGVVTSTLTSPIVPGTTIVKAPVDVRRN